MFWEGMQTPALQVVVPTRRLPCVAWPSPANIEACTLGVAGDEPSLPVGLTSSKFHDLDTSWEANAAPWTRKRLHLHSGIVLPVVGFSILEAGERTAAHTVVPCPEQLVAGCCDGPCRITAIL